MAVFPKIIAIGSVVTQYPYTETAEWCVATSSLDSGAVFTRSQHEVFIRRFKVNFPLIQRADVITLQTFFLNMHGSFDDFEFTDDHGNVWPRTRFDQDIFEAQALGPNQYSVELKLATCP